MRYFFCLLLPLTFMSCATIFNSPTCITDIRTGVPMTAIISSDTVALRERTPNIIFSERSRRPKEIVLVRDESIDTVALMSRWSAAYYLNFTNPYSMTTGVIVDNLTRRKWRYPETVLLTDRWIGENRPGTPTFYNRYARQGALNLRLSFPYVNWFHSAYGNESISSGGFCGMSLGLDYYYGDKMFLNLSGGAIAELPFPEPVLGILLGVQDEYLFSFYGSLSNNHLLGKNRFSVGYGVSYGHDRWNTVYNIRHRRPDDVPEEETERRTNVYRRSNSLGFASSFYYYTKRSFYMGAVYRPMLWQFAGGDTRFKYQHTASFDFGWRIGLKK